MSKRKLLISLAGLILLVILGFLFSILQHWLAIHTGTLNEPGPYYGFWSGFGGIMERLIELIVIGGILLFRHNCHQPGCLNIGRFPDDKNQGWHYCRKHHNNHGEQP